MAKKPWCNVTRWRQVEASLDILANQAWPQNPLARVAYLHARQVMAQVEKQAREGKHERIV